MFLAAGPGLSGLGAGKEISSLRLSIGSRLLVLGSSSFGFNLLGLPGRGLELGSRHSSVSFGDRDLSCVACRLKGHGPVVLGVHVGLLFGCLGVVLGTFLGSCSKNGGVLSGIEGNLGIVAPLLSFVLVSLLLNLHGLKLVGSLCRLGKSNFGFSHFTLGVSGSSLGFITCVFGTNSRSVGCLSVRTCGGCISFRSNSIFEGVPVLLLCSLLVANSLVGGDEGIVASDFGVPLVFLRLLHRRGSSLHLEFSMTLSACGRSLVSFSLLLVLISLFLAVNRIIHSSFGSVFTGLGFSSSSSGLLSSCDGVLLGLHPGRSNVSGVLRCSSLFVHGDLSGLLGLNSGFFSGVSIGFSRSLSASFGDSTVVGCLPIVRSFLGETC